MRGRFLLTLFAAAALCRAEEMVQKVLDVKYASMIDAVQLARTFNVNAQILGRTLAVSGSAAAIDAVELGLKKIDIPGARANVDLAGYILQASDRASEPTGAMPDGLEAVVKQLRALFQYKDYRLLDSFALRGESGASGGGAGILAGLGNYTYQYRVLTVTGDKERTIQFQDFKFVLARASFPTQVIETSVDLKEGQKVVIGKTSMADSPLILVITARVVD